MYLAVNLSGRHLLDPAVVNDVWGALDTSGFDPRLLVLEITETVLLQDLVTAAAHLTTLRAGGVRVAVDDFGTGYTSIAHLRHLPVDILKIDRSFVTEIDGKQRVPGPVDGRDRGDARWAWWRRVETAEEFEQLRLVGCQVSIHPCSPGRCRRSC